MESQAAELSKLEGQYAAPRLKLFIELNRKGLNAEADNRDLYTRIKVRLLLAYVLRVYGEQAGISQPLEEAITTLHEALKERTRERVPLDWATTQNDLGLALMSLGQRGTGTARLEAAVTAYQEALKERTRERAPNDWATAQGNLGFAFETLGERTESAARLEAAVAAHQEALQVYRGGADEYDAKSIKDEMQRVQKTLDKIRTSKH